MLVRDLVKQLSELPQGGKVQCWLPGCYIDLVRAFDTGSKILIEGNVHGPAPILGLEFPETDDRQR